MMQTLSDIDPQLVSYTTELHKYLLQHNFMNFSGHLFFKNYSTSGFGKKYQYLVMGSTAPGEVSAIDLLLIQNQNNIHIYAVYGAYCMEIPLQEGMAQFEKNEKLVQLEGKLSENIEPLWELYNQPVYSQETIQKMQLLKIIAQQAPAFVFESAYYLYCEATLVARNLRLNAIKECYQKNLFSKQYHQFQ